MTSQTVKQVNSSFRDSILYLVFEMMILNEELPIIESISIQMQFNQSVVPDDCKCCQMHLDVPGFSPSFDPMQDIKRQWELFDSLLRDEVQEFNTDLRECFNQIIHTLRFKYIMLQIALLSAEILFAVGSMFWIRYMDSPQYGGIYFGLFLVITIASFYVSLHLIDRWCLRKCFPLLHPKIEQFAQDLNHKWSESQSLWFCELKYPTVNLNWFCKNQLSCIIVQQNVVSNRLN
jgi:hypothetical protein